MIDYAATYTEDFFNQADGIEHWKKRKLKCGDALAAIAYAFGLTFEELRAIVPFSGVGRNLEDNSIDAVEQISRVLNTKKRTPRGLLEIGSGRGEVAITLACAGYPVQAVEPSMGAVAWLTRTAQTFFDRKLEHIPLKLHNAPVHEVIDVIDWSTIDTVLMVESLEHILAEDFTLVYQKIRDHLRTVGGRFIVTNWIDYHPLQIGDHASTMVHCRTVDDTLYDEWCRDAKTVVHRNGAHLVLEY